MARKPLVGTVAANVLQHGTGALNIDATRIRTDDDRGRPRGTFPHSDDAWGNGHLDRTESNPLGRWPANVVLDEAAAEMLDQMSGERKTSNQSTAGVPRQRGNGWGNTYDGPHYGDTGGASRFFYTAKASRAERNAGLDGMPELDTTALYGQGVGLSGRTMIDGEWVNTDAPRKPKANVHPTVKPIALMRWLVRLVTPPGGLILDPFAGSGSTGCAAALEGFRFVGIEQDAEYAEIAERRIAYWAAQRPTVLQPALPLEGAAD